MPAIVIEHVPVTELPAHWQARLPGGTTARVTVRIEEEVNTPHDTLALTVNPLFGMWADHEAVADVAAYVQTLRAPRNRPDGSRREE